jgi:pimeloyl-ACP methyl ester carboxylesterase
VNTLQAYAEAATIMAATLDLPGTSPLTRRRAQPRVLEDILAGCPVTSVQPVCPPPWATVIFMNGATPDGRAHPTVVRIGIALARSGHLVIIPDLPGVAGGELSPATLGAAIALAQAVAERPEVSHGRVALAGVSVGAALALLTAADPRVAGRVSVVGAVGPYGDLANVARLATTHTYRDRRTSFSYPVPPSLAVGLARSLASTLEQTPEAIALYGALLEIDAASAAARDLPENRFLAAGPEATALFALLSNRDPDLFDELYAALPGHIRATIRDLSPLHAVSGLRAPVEIVTEPRDKYFPIAEARALAAASPHVRVTVTSLLAHATPRVSTRSLMELARLCAFFVRVLRGAHAGPDSLEVPPR